MALSIASKPYLYAALQTVAEQDPTKIGAFQQQVKDLETRLDRATARGPQGLAGLKQDLAALHANSASLGPVQQVFIDLIAKSVEDVAPQAKNLLPSAHSFSQQAFTQTAAASAGFQLGNEKPQADLSKVQVQAKPIGRDAASEVTAARIKGDQLEVDVRYGGGLAEHQFQLSWDGGFLETFPVQARMELTHNDNQDGGEALLSRTLTFDLSPLKEAYQRGYGDGPGKIGFRVGEPSQRLEYSF